MFINFFLELKQARLPVSLREYLSLLEGMQLGLADYSIDDFYYLSRTCLVKDEGNLDRFDVVFAKVFKGLEPPAEGEVVDLPAEWLRKMAERVLTEEEKALVQSLGGWDKLMETLQKRLAEQKGRHQGGSKWIGTAGTSPFGAYGYNPEGVRIGQDGNRNNRAVKVWDKREFRNLDATAELGTRNIKVALRRLRRFARDGAATELDLPATIRSTATLTLRWFRSGTMRSRCCFSSTLAARWTRLSRSVPNCSPLPEPSSSIWSIFIFTIASMNKSGATIGAVTPR